MKLSLWKLAFVVVLTAGLAFAQYGSSQSQTQSTSPSSDQTSSSQQQQPSSSTSGSMGQSSSQQQPSSGTSGSTSGSMGSSTSGSMGQSSSAASSGMGAADAQAIQQALQQDSSLSGVTANVKGDKVELSGTVASKADKDKAKSIAETNAGGKKVVDHIKVSSSSASPSSTPPPQ